MSQNIYNPNQKILNLSVPGLEVGDTLRYIAHDIATSFADLNRIGPARERLVRRFGLVSIIIGLLLLYFIRT